MGVDHRRAGASANRRSGVPLLEAVCPAQREEAHKAAAQRERSDQCVLAHVDDDHLHVVWRFNPVAENTNAFQLRTTEWHAAVEDGEALEELRRHQHSAGGQCGTVHDEHQSCDVELVSPDVDVAYGSFRRTNS